MSEMSTAPVPSTQLCDPLEQQARQDALDDLYERDGRDRHDHPLHGLYTGLAQQYLCTSAQ